MVWPTQYFTPPLLGSFTAPVLTVLVQLCATNLMIHHTCPVVAGLMQSCTHPAAWEFYPLGEDHMKLSMSRRSDSFVPEPRVLHTA
eukprot:4355994-Amphidinium_carterae.1